MSLVSNNPFRRGMSSELIHMLLIINIYNL